MPDDLVPLSPEWWLRRLYRQLVAGRAEIEFYDAYYRGDHPLPWLAPQARDEFRRVLQMTRANYMGLVCDAQVEREAVEGFRVDPDAESADRETWRIWQANNLDSYSDQGFLEAAIGGRAYLLVAPNPDDSTTPIITVEHATQAIVEHVPGTNRRIRAAALKVWDDDWTGELHAMLQLPGTVWKYRAPRPSSEANTPEWAERIVTGEQPNGQRPNPLGVVSLVELPNNPRLLTGGRSELADLTDSQDRANKTLADRLITQDYGAFPQRWASAWPDTDEDGVPNRIDIGRNRMVTTDVAETRFGQWDAALLSPYSEAKREDVKDIASRSRTPAQYLLGEMSNVNGDTLKASESGLIAKVRRRCRDLAEGLEESMRIARSAAGLPDVGAAMETVWRNPEFRTEGELTDATVKKLQSRIASLRQARVDVGYSEATIRRLEAEDDAAALDPIATSLLQGATGQPADDPAFG